MYCRRFVDRTVRRLRSRWEKINKNNTMIVVGETVKKGRKTRAVEETFFFFFYGNIIDRKSEEEEMVKDANVVLYGTAARGSWFFKVGRETTRKISVYLWDQKKINRREKEIE